MRDDFFGPLPAAALSAELVLTPSEAFWGTTVPLEVPLRRTCRSCGGRGETWGDWCLACGGLGEVTSMHQVHLRVPAATPEGLRFRFTVRPPGAPVTLVEIRVTIR